MSFWESENIRAVVGGTWLAKPQQPCRGVSTDSRTIEPGEAFIALAGDHFDGHHKLADAAKAGSPLAIIDSPARAGALPAGMGILQVRDSTRRALARLAAAYRKALDGAKVIAVAGSNGKTTTVRLIDAVLGTTMKGSASVKSFNNDIGVPLTILRASPGDGYLICEVGTNAPTEIARLSEIVSPDIAVIVSIGREHLEKLGSLAGVAREEASVLEFVRPGGAGIYNADAPELAAAIAAIPEGHRPRAMIGFGAGPTADIRVAETSQDWDGLSFTLNDRASFRLGLLGAHNASNAAAAIAVGRRLNIPDDRIAAGLASATGPDMRLERLTIGGIRILNDAYNANPDSMRAGLETLRHVRSAGRKVVVLGDMLELGDHTESEHRAIGELLRARPDLGWIVLIGPSMRWAAEVLPTDRVVWLPELDDDHAAEAAAGFQDGDLVLVKGSRRMKLERLVEAIRARFGAVACA
jgi:UDP-N-acetylmuramoyl-tripeptide--D-alanyl-D-alanine ligase